MSIPNTQWKYLLIGEGLDVRGTDDSKVAKAAADGGADMVIEVMTSTVLLPSDAEVLRENIPEQTDYKFN